MKEAYVKFRTAKRLKEKGFDWELRTYYNEDGDELTLHDDFADMSNSEIDTCDPDYIDYLDIYCTRPTQQMACDWLREEKNIYVTAVPDIGNSLRFYPAIYVIKGEMPEEYWFEHINSVVEELNKSYDKPQQAIEAALEFVLTKLI